MDQQALRTIQYGNSGNLSARAALHNRFSTNRTGWQHWVFDQFEFPSKAKVLEVGAGPGWLWKNNVTRIPAGWQITLSDFSDGMLDDARTNLAEIDRPFAFEVCDVQALPFDDATFHAVIANHMLYHVPDIVQAIREIHRILVPGGLFYAATNGPKHLREIHDLGERVAPGMFGTFRQEFKQSSFDLEGGGEQIGALFGQVEKRIYEDALVVTEAEPLVAYILSMVPAEFHDGEQVAALRTLIEEEMAATGAIVIAKDSGMFIARKT